MKRVLTWFGIVLTLTALCIVLAHAPSNARAADYRDVRQTQSPTCFFLASLSSAVYWDSNFSSCCKDLGNGRFEVTLFFNGENFKPRPTRPLWVKVMVDIDLSRMTIHDPEPITGETNLPSRWWPAVIQRAYYSLWDVDPPETGYRTSTPDWNYVATALETLTGCRTGLFRPGDDPARDDFEVIYKALYSYHKRMPIVAGTIDHSHQKKVIARGTCLVENHAYSIIGATREGRLLRLRNPWGRDVNWDELKQSGNRWIWSADGAPYRDGLDDNPTDGEIQITMETFVKYFSHYVITKPELISQERLDTPIHSFKDFRDRAELKQYWRN